MGLNMNILKKYSKKTFIISGVVLLAIVATLIIFKRSSNSKENYVIQTVNRGNIDINILSTGIVKPENRLEIKPPIAGRIDNVLVDEGQYVKKGQVLLRMSSIERAALLDAAQARGAEELRKWETFYKPAPILAPIDGMIIARNVEPGQSFTTQEAVLVMSDRLTVKAQVDETDIAQIALRQKAAVILDAYPNDEIPAHVDKIAFDATTINNVTTYIVDVLPEKTPEFMRSGMTANVRFDIASKKDILVLPSNAIRNKDAHHFVTIPADLPVGKPKEKEIEVGAANGKMVEIVSGLSEGDVVLVKHPKNGKTSQSTPLSSFGAPKR